MQVLNSLTDRLAFVFLLVQDEAEKIGLDADGFEERLMGDDFAHEASKAFLEETESFFRKLGQKGLVSLAKNSVTAMDAGRTRLSDLTDSGDFDSMIRKMVGMETMESESGSPSQS